MSLTRNTTLASLMATAARVSPGMSLKQVIEIADQNSAESASSWVESLFLFRDGMLADDAFLRSARDDSKIRESSALAWAARVWAEPRIAEVVEQTLTDARGHFDAAAFSVEVVSSAFEELGVGQNPRKAASSLLNQAASVPLFIPEKHGTAIVGASRFTRTAEFVPSVVEFLEERIGSQVGNLVTKRGDAIELALLWKANRWFGLSKDEFRRAAQPLDPVQQSSRITPPEELRLLHEELQRRKQVIIQGAPGTGKTFVALQYIDWASAGRRDDSNLSKLMAELPQNERTPHDVAREAIRRGLSCLWEIAQLHPSYGYEDFVRTLAPSPTANGVSFKTEHRVLSFLSAVAIELRELDSDCIVALVVDEMNRADIARVFGELLYALEYRDEPVSTPYALEGDASITLPSNLLILGTINTADRSIALIDYALRRRFTFITLEPDASVIDAADWVGTSDREGARRLFDAVDLLFSRSSENLTLAIGHSYFLPSGSPSTEEESLSTLARRFAYEVVPLLKEYAAEGLVDEATLAATLGAFGIDVDQDGQGTVEQAVLSSLTDGL